MYKFTFHMNEDKYSKLFTEFLILYFKIHYPNGNFLDALLNHLDSTQIKS